MKLPGVFSVAVLAGTARVILAMEEPMCLEPDYAYYFGPKAIGGEIDAAGAYEVPVVLRNAGPVLGFTLGIRKAGDRLSFESTLGPEPGLEVELIIVKGDATELSGGQLKGNSARGALPWDITGIHRGKDLFANYPGDFLGIDLAPAAGGPGATVGYVADFSRPGKAIPAVLDRGIDCGANEILILEFNVQPEGFSRGDANGDGRINILDAVVIAHNIFAGKYVFFDCEDMLDVNDDGRLDVRDPVELLSYLFLKGPMPLRPFRTCGFDGTDDTLGCRQPNCLNSRA